jgi:hypothetical protein
MIQLSDNVAWVRTDNGRAAPFDVARLSASVMRAAAQAGHGDWWLGEAVAVALEEFVVAHCARQTIAADSLSELVQGVLVSLGYADIAAAYAHRNQHAEVRLDQMTDTPSELEFFRRLDAALQAVRDNECASVQIHGLRSCVMRLRGAHYWSAGCRRMAEEILCHVRERVARAHRNKTGTLRLTVIE